MRTIGRSNAEEAKGRTIWFPRGRSQGRGNSLDPQLCANRERLRTGMRSNTHGGVS